MLYYSFSSAPNALDTTNAYLELSRRLERSTSIYMKNDPEFTQWPQIPVPIKGCQLCCWTFAALKAWIHGHYRWSSTRLLWWGFSLGNKYGHYFWSFAREKKNMSQKRRIACRSWGRDLLLVGNILRKFWTMQILFSKSCAWWSEKFN